MGLADDLRDYLSTSGITGSIFVGEAPEVPDACLAVIPTAGIGPTRTLSANVGNAPVEHCRAQVTARGTTYAACSALMQSAYTKLSGVGERDINSRRYYYVVPVQTPFYLGLDEAARPVFVANFDILRAEST